MARKGYTIGDQQAIYYLTFTVVGWIDIFSRKYAGLDQIIDVDCLFEIL